MPHSKHLLLREAFDYSHRETSDALQIEEANARQPVSRARKHIAQGPRRTPPSLRERQRLLEAFIGPPKRRDGAALEGLFVEDVVSYSNGGGIVRTAAGPRSPVASALQDSLPASLTFLDGRNACVSRTSGQAKMPMLLVPRSLE
jgi:hypothetical protein